MIRIDNHGTRTMRLTSLALVATLTLAGAIAHAQSSTMGPIGSAASTTGLAGSTTGAAANGGLDNSAGSIAAGANSALNPSGNSFINTSPSGSTLAPIGPGVH
jgi:hypothetical protein